MSPEPLRLCPGVGARATGEPAGIGQGEPRGRVHLLGVEHMHAIDGASLHIQVSLELSHTQFSANTSTSSKTCNSRVWTKICTSPAKICRNLPRAAHGLGWPFGIWTTILCYRFELEHQAQDHHPQSQVKVWNLVCLAFWQVPLHMQDTRLLRNRGKYISEPNIQNGHCLFCLCLWPGQSISGETCSRYPT